MSKLMTNERFLKFIDKTSNPPCWEWKGGKDSSGYGKFVLKGRIVRSHRYSYEAAKGEIPEGLIVRHLCHNRSCVNPEHLDIGTYKDNYQDMREAGRENQLKGIYNPNSALDREQVAEIREKYIRGSSDQGQLALSKEFNVSRSTIRNIVNKASYMDLEYTPKEKEYFLPYSQMEVAKYVELLCLQCQKPFNISERDLEYRASINSNIFCGQECYLAYKRKSAEHQIYHRVLSKLEVNSFEGDYCWEWEGMLQKNLHPVISYLSKTIRPARWIYEKFKGSIPEGKYVLQVCLNHKCCRPDHLTLGDDLDKSELKNKLDLKKREISNPNNLLLEKEIREMYEDIKSRKMTFEEISYKYKISPSRLTALIQGRAWKHLDLTPIKIEKLLERGEDRYNSTLTKEKVIKLKKYKLMGFSNIVASRMAGLTNEDLCHNILSGRAWKHVEVASFTEEEKLEADIIYQNLDIKVKKEGQRMSEEEIQKMLLLWSQGKSFSDIARELNKTVSAISRRIKKLPKT